MKRLALTIFASALLATGAMAQDEAAADWPEREIKLIVPFPPGNNTDNVARIIGEALTARLGQSVIIENRPGASGAIGINAVATAEPDGYTIGIGTASTQTVAAVMNPNLPYDPLEDFAELGRIGSVPYVLAANPNLAAKTVADLIALAKAEPGKLRYGSVGEASLANLATLLLSNSEGIEMTHVPYKSAGAAALDVIAGRIDLQFSTLGATLPFIQSGQLRALAVATAERVDELPDAPTISESGVPGYETSLWFSLVAPAGTPEAIVTRLNSELDAALADPAVIEDLRRQAVTPKPNAPAEMAEVVRTDIAKWRKVAEDAGLEVQQ